jgi:hypothetical protein
MRFLLPFAIDCGNEAGFVAVNGWFLGECGILTQGRISGVDISRF